jgi:hypothetical protein
MGQLEGKDRERLKLQNLAKEKEGEILESQEELDRKEHEVVWVENQLEKVWIDHLEATNALQTTKDARIEAKEHESKIHSEMRNTLAAMEETRFKVAVLKHCETELRDQLEGEVVH